MITHPLFAAVLAPSANILRSVRGLHHHGQAHKCWSAATKSGRDKSSSLSVPVPHCHRHRHRRHNHHHLETTTAATSTTAATTATTTAPANAVVESAVRRRGSVGESWPLCESSRPPWCLRQRFSALLPEGARKEGGHDRGAHGKEGGERSMSRPVGCRHHPLSSVSAYPK
jgi:hypothetical protein